MRLLKLSTFVVSLHPHAQPYIPNLILMLLRFPFGLPIGPQLPSSRQLPDL